MEKTCDKCGQPYTNDTEICSKCGKELTVLIPKAEKKLPYGFAIGSLILAGIVVIPLFWLDVTIIESDWAMNYFAGHYGDSYYIVVIASAIYLFLTIIGIVLASIGIKKGTIIISLFGLGFNLILITIIILKLVVLNLAYFH